MTKQRDVIKLAKSKGYYINDLGVVFSPKKVVVNLKLYRGYFLFNIRINGKVTRCPVHRLQSYQKYGDAIFENGIVTRHLDGNPINNSFSNIAIGTQSQNMMDIPASKRILNASNPKHNHEQVIDLHNEGFSYLEIMRKLSITSKGTISFILNKSLKKQGIKK